MTDVEEGLVINISCSLNIEEERDFDSTWKTDLILLLDLKLAKLLG